MVHGLPKHQYITTPGLFIHTRYGTTMVVHAEEETLVASVCPRRLLVLWKNFMKVPKQKVSKIGFFLFRQASSKLWLSRNGYCMKQQHFAQQCTPPSLFWRLARHSHKHVPTTKSCRTAIMMLYNRILLFWMQSELSKCYGTRKWCLLHRSDKDHYTVKIDQDAQWRSGFLGKSWTWACAGYWAL